MDLTYRFDPSAPIPSGSVADAESAVRRLSEGNRRFAKIVGMMQERMQGGDSESIVIPVHPVNLGLPLMPGVVLSQSPFALVLCCSDARVNVESIFDQSFNSLFVVRIAGNILGTECLGSVDYALRHLADSLKIVVVLGHSHCGAVSAAVDSYLAPQDFGEIAFSHPLRSLVDRMQIAVRISAKTMLQKLGEEIRNHSRFREALIESSVYLNAAVTAFDLVREVENVHAGNVRVVFGVYDFETLLVQAHPGISGTAAESAETFRDAPNDQEEFQQLTADIVDDLRQRYIL